MKRAMVAASLILASAIASAEVKSMRCGNTLVQRGDHITEVRARCGDPEFSQEVQNKFGATIGLREVYDIGHGRPKHEVTYHGTEVVRIKRIW